MSFIETCHSWQPYLQRKKTKNKSSEIKGILTSIKHKNKLFTIKIKTNSQESIYIYKKIIKIS